jgi:hypothetical protein
VATERINDLRAFKGFIDKKLSNGGTNRTVDEALMNWEIENQKVVILTSQGLADGSGDCNQTDFILRSLPGQ